MIIWAPVYCNIGESPKLCLSALAERIFSGHLPSRAECRYPSFLTLYQSSPLQDRNYNSREAHSCREAPRDHNRFAYWPWHSASPGLVTYVCIIILPLQGAQWTMRRLHRPGAPVRHPRGFWTLSPHSEHVSEFPSFLYVASCYWCRGLFLLW